MQSIGYLTPIAVSLPSNLCLNLPRGLLPNGFSRNIIHTSHLLRNLLIPWL
jgi:hypothetical protein